MNKLRNMVLEFLKTEGYGVIESLGYWNDYKKEIKTKNKGKHTLYIGKDHQITYVIK